MISGETDLGVLIASMEPELAPDIYVFATVSHDAPGPPGALMRFREREGTTLILLEAEAKAAGIVAVFPSRMITLNIHSSLEAVGFVAAIAARLTTAGMGINPVAGYYHDHLFIAADRADEAMTLLREMALEAGAHE